MAYSYAAPTKQRRVARGPPAEPSFHPEDVLRLTELQSRIAKFVASGRTNEEIANALKIGPRSVVETLDEVYAVLGLQRVPKAKKETH